MEIRTEAFCAVDPFAATAGEAPRATGVTLNRAAAALLVRLPADYYPHVTVRQFPHVINMLADAWQDKDEFVRCARGLLVRSARRRRGFPVAVFNEIFQLVMFHGSVMSIAPFDELNIEQTPLRD